MPVPRWRCAYRGYKAELAGSPDKAPAAIRVHLPGGAALTGATKRSWPVARIRRQPLSGVTGSDTFSLPVVSQHRGEIQLDPVRQRRHLLAHLQAERRQTIFNMRRHHRIRNAVDKAILFQRL